MNVQAAMNWGVSLALIGVECVGGGLDRSRVGWHNGRVSASTTPPALGSYWNYYHSKSRGSGTAEIASCARFRESRDGVLEVYSSTGKRPHVPLLCRKRENRSMRGAGGFSPILHLNFVKSWGLRSSRTSIIMPIRCSVGTGDDHMPSGTSAYGENSPEMPQLLSSVPEGTVSLVGGKIGSLSFYARRSESSVEKVVEFVPTSRRNSKLLSLVWILGPFILVSSVVLPPLYLRKFFGAVLEDSLMTDFVILFFTETLFFTGAALFLYIAHISRVATAAAASLMAQKPAPPIYSLGYRLSSKIALTVGVLLPAASFVLVWPWTGPAAAAALAPYMVGLLVQLGFEQIIRANVSPVWPLVPVTFQMYRLHQLNRAAQLVAGLLFSLKGVEATAETIAINGSLQSLLLVLQILGMLCLWSLGSFLTNQLPSKFDQQSIPSLP